MAQFRAVIQGARGAASRLGTKRSLMHATVQSYEGQVNIVMWHAEGDPLRDTGDYVRITLSPHGDAASPRCVCIYDGPCDGWRAQLAMTAVKIANRELVTTGVSSDA